MLILIFLFLSISLISKQDIPSLAALNIVTMVPQATVDSDAPFTPAFAAAAQGIKQLTNDIRAKKNINTTIVAINKRAKKINLLRFILVCRNVGIPTAKKLFLSILPDG
jgi:hypothetical protein